VSGQGLKWRDHNKDRYKLKGANKGEKYAIQSRLFGYVAKQLERMPLSYHQLYLC